MQQKSQSIRPTFLSFCMTPSSFIATRTPQLFERLFFKNPQLFYNAKKQSERFNAQSVYSIHLVKTYYAQLHKIFQLFYIKNFYSPSAVFYKSVFDKLSYRSACDFSYGICLFCNAFLRYIKFGFSRANIPFYQKRGNSSIISCKK